MDEDGILRRQVKDHSQILLPRKSKLPRSVDAGGTPNLGYSYMWVYVKLISFWPHLLVDLPMFFKKFCPGYGLFL